MNRWGAPGLRPSGCCDGGSGATDIYFSVWGLQALAQAHAQLVSAPLPGPQTASLGTRGQGLPGASSGADPSHLPTASPPGAQPNQLGVRIQHEFGGTHKQTVACPCVPGLSVGALLPLWTVASRVTPCSELGLPGRTSLAQGPGPGSPSTCLTWVFPAAALRSLKPRPAPSPGVCAQLSPVSRPRAHPARLGGGDRGSRPTLSLSGAGGSSCSNSCSKCWREI